MKVIGCWNKAKRLKMKLGTHDNEKVWTLWFHHYQHRKIFLIFKRCKKVSQSHSLVFDLLTSSRRYKLLILTRLREWRRRKRRRLSNALESAVDQLIGGKFKNGGTRRRGRSRRRTAERWRPGSFESGTAVGWDRTRRYQRSSQTGFVKF